MSRIHLTLALTPTVVAQRLCELLHQFPVAAVGGVRWQTLLHKYEEVYKLPLNTAAFGHSSAVGAATALLWEVLRPVDMTDTTNPSVALDDHVVLMPHPSQLACWPSLYEALSKLVVEHAASHRQDDEERSQGVPLLQLRGMLKKVWHRCFDERRLCYLSADGRMVRVESMQELLGALLQWRAQRCAWRAASAVGPNAMDEALCIELELAPTSCGGELQLRRAHCPQAPREVAARSREEQKHAFPKRSLSARPRSASSSRNPKMKRSVTWFHRHFGP